MKGILLLEVLVWASYVYIMVVYTARSIRYARMPLHLRWELYPVPHEKNSKYGGSYLEELEWWQKPRGRSRLKDIIFMVKDYLFLVQYFERNRRYWAVLYVWHISFYLIVGFHILVALGAVASLAGVNVSAESASFLGRALYYPALVAGVVAFVAGPLGSIGMLIRRLTDADLKSYATPRHYFSYVFYLAVFLSGLVTWVFFDRDFSAYREFYRSVITFGPSSIEPAGIVHAVFFALFLFYMPLTPALHYVTKLFMFFSIRWNDTPNLAGNGMEEKIQKLLGQRVTWSAPHIQSGKKWSEVATEVQFPEKAVRDK